jgi:D-aminopeptidase
VFGQTNQIKPRIREIGVTIGVLSPGKLNAITDVPGVQVGHKTVIKKGTICTGVTAILPHGGNLYKEKVPGAVFIGNAFGKLIGSTQVNELGEIETPILLTSTLSASKVADSLISYMLAVKGNEQVLSINPLVGETNDGYLNDIRARPITNHDVFQAIHTSKVGPVAEGNVGAGAGTVAFGFKGGIGTSSRVIPAELGGYTVGVIVQTNFGGVLSIAGVPIGKHLGQYYLREYIEKTKPLNRKKDKPDGSIMIVIATNAPLDHRNLTRLAARAMMGLARTGASGSNGSGDYAIAFSTALDLRINANGKQYRPKLLNNDDMSPLFEAVIEATEEAIYNSLFQAQDTRSNGHIIQALPVDKVVSLLKNYRAISISN